MCLVETGSAFNLAMMAQLSISLLIKENKKYHEDEPETITIVVFLLLLYNFFQANSTCQVVIKGNVIPEDRTREGSASFYNITNLKLSCCN